MYVPTTTIYQEKRVYTVGRKWKIIRQQVHTTFGPKIFFIMDKIKNGDVKIAFYPTHNMLGNFFTKPLQGSLFICMREKILNLPSGAGATVHRRVLGNNENITKI